MQKILFLFSNSIEWDMQVNMLKKGNTFVIPNTFPIKEKEINLQNIEWKGHGEISWTVSAAK